MSPPGSRRLGLRVPWEVKVLMVSRMVSAYRHGRNRGGGSVVLDDAAGGVMIGSYNHLAL